MDFAQFRVRQFARQPGASGEAFHSRRPRTQDRAQQVATPRTTFHEPYFIFRKRERMLLAVCVRLARVCQGGHFGGGDQAGKDHPWRACNRWGLITSGQPFSYYCQFILTMLRKIWQVTGCTKRVPRYTKLTVRPIAFGICVTCYRQNWPFGQENWFFEKKTPQNRKSGLTDFGRPWTPNSLTPGQLQAYPWKLGGMTVQTSYVGGRWHQNWPHTSPQIFFPVWTRKFAEKWFFG